MDISVALCIIAKVKVVYTSTDCSVLLPGKSHSQHDNHFWSERESAKLQYNIYNNWRTEWGANITKHAATIKIRLQCTLISQKLAKVQMFLACKKYCSIMVCTWTFLSRVITMVIRCFCTYVFFSSMQKEGPSKTSWDFQLHCPCPEALWEGNCPGDWRTTNPSVRILDRFLHYLYLIHLPFPVTLTLHLLLGTVILFLSSPPPLLMWEYWRWQEGSWMVSWKKWSLCFRYICISLNSSRNTVH